jgi:hypothetical protein
MAASQQVDAFAQQLGGEFVQTVAPAVQASMMILPDSCKSMP